MTNSFVEASGSEDTNVGPMIALRDNQFHRFVKIAFPLQFLHSNSPFEFDEFIWDMCEIK